MPVPLILGGAAAAGALFNIISGIGQNKKANKALARYETLQGERPVFRTPDEALQILTMAQQAYADPTVPGQQVAEDRIGQNFSNVISAASQAGNPFAVLSGAQANANQSALDVMTSGQQYKDRQRMELNDALGMIAGYRDTEFQMNEFAPWADKTQFALNDYRDYRNAGNKNIASGIGGLSNIALSMLSSGIGSNPVGTAPNPSTLASIYQKHRPPVNQSSTAMPAPY